MDSYNGIAVQDSDIFKNNNEYIKGINTKKYHVFAPMGRIQLESIYLYFPPSSLAWARRQK